MKAALSLLALVLLAAGVACSEHDRVGSASDVRPPGTAEPSREPAGPPQMPVVPGATLTTAASGAVEGGKGTRCWSGPGYGGCIDYVSAVTNERPLVVAAGELLTVSFTSGPDDISAAWMAAPPGSPTPNSDGVMWSSSEPLPQLAPATATLIAPRDPGRHILLVWARWHGQGDVSFGFYIEVK